MTKKVRRSSLAPPIICIVTFCIVSVVVVDAVIPLGYILVDTLRDTDLAIAVRVLLVTPMAGLLISSFVSHTRTRSILTIACLSALVGLWILGLFLFVAHPMYPTPHPGSVNIVPVVTSIPFLVAVIVTITNSVRDVVSERREKSNR